MSKEAVNKEWIRLTGAAVSAHQAHLMELQANVRRTRSVVRSAVQAYEESLVLLKKPERVTMPHVTAGNAAGNGEAARDRGPPDRR